MGLGSGDLRAARSRGLRWLTLAVALLSAGLGPPASATSAFSGSFANHQVSTDPLLWSSAWADASSDSNNLSLTTWLWAFSPAAPVPLAYDWARASSGADLSQPGLAAGSYTATVSFRSIFSNADAHWDADGPLDVATTLLATTSLTARAVAIECTNGCDADHAAVTSIPVRICGWPDCPQGVNVQLSVPLSIAASTGTAYVRAWLQVDSRLVGAGHVFIQTQGALTDITISEGDGDA